MYDSKVGVADKGYYKTFNVRKVNFTKNQFWDFFLVQTKEPKLVICHIETLLIEDFKKK